MVSFNEIGIGHHFSYGHKVFVKIDNKTAFDWSTNKAQNFKCEYVNKDVVVEMYINGQLFYC